MPLLVAGARPWFWSMVAALFLLGSSVLVWTEPQSVSLFGISRKTIFAVGLLVILPFLQIIPLPESWFALLSPQRLMWIDKASERSEFHASWHTISYTPLITFYRGLWFIFLALFALVCRHALEDGDSRWLLRVLFILVGFEAFYGLLQVLIPSLGVIGAGDVAHAYSGYARGTFNNRNHFAAFLNMSWPLLLAALLTEENPANRMESGKRWREDRGQKVRRLEGEKVGVNTPGLEFRISEGGAKSKGAAHHERSYLEPERLLQVRQKKIFLGFILGLVLLALFFSASRGGIGASLVALTVFAVFAGSRRKALFVFVASCWIVVLAYGSIIGFEEVLARFNMMEKDAPGRFQIWEVGWRIVKDHLFTGTGLGSFGDVFRVYQNYMDDLRTTNYAHNDYVQMAVELGVPVAVSLFVLVWGYWWRAAWRIARGGRREAGGKKAAKDISEFGIRNSERKVGGKKSIRGNLDAAREYEDLSWQSSVRQQASGFQSLQFEVRNLLSVGALAGSAAFLCHSWVEFNWQIPADALYFVMLLVLMGG